jgi:hypothetical protein
MKPTTEFCRKSSFKVTNDYPLHVPVVILKYVLISGKAGIQEPDCSLMATRVGELIFWTSTTG